MTERIPHARPFLSSKGLQAVECALRNGHLSQGCEVLALEHALCHAFGRRHAVVVSSGTSALALSLLAVGVRKGDHVCMPSYTCQCLCAAIRYADAIPALIDCKPNDVCMEDEHIHGVMGTVQPAAVVVPHMFGYAAGTDKWRAQAIPVIEDCAQAAGGVGPDGVMLGRRGRIAIVSFYGTKLIPAGEGGACLTDDDELAERIRALRNCDERPLERKAFNFKMTDVMAALAREQLGELMDTLASRSAIAVRYDEAFGQHAFRVRHALDQPVCFRYLLELPSGKVEAFIDAASGKGIDCRRPVWKPLHHTLGGQCPESDRRHETLISIPLYPSLSDDDQKRVCEGIAGLLDG